MTDVVQPVRDAGVAPIRRRLRDDVILDHGRLSLVNAALTPADATVADLLFLRSALDAAGIDVLLVRGQDERPVLVVDRKLRKEVQGVLAAACADEPFYSRRADGVRTHATLVADGHFTDRATGAILLFRPRVTAVGGLRYAAAGAVRLEFWRFGVDSISAPSPNSLTRPRVPRAEFVTERIERFGEQWTTIEGMFLPRADDIRFDIDMVFSWVDGSSIEWQRARARRMKSYVVGEGDDSQARFRQLDELKYALRSVYLFAPWIRNVYIVTDSPRPEWLDEHPRVQLVPSTEFFADPSVLPTHNSHAVESQLANIPGIAEHFLYSNDDMFFARPVSPQAFFSAGGVTRFIEATTRIGLGENNPERSGFENAARVNRALLEERFGVVITRHLEHTPVPLVKSVMRELEAEFPEDFRRTAASRFRSASDISVTNSLYHYYALLTGRAVIERNVKALYVDTTAKSGLTAMRKVLGKRNVDLLCLNDGSFPEISDEERAEAVRSFLDGYYPIAGPWEKPESEVTLGQLG
ncbi:MAG: sugar phosphotransferase [Microbacteriaceae bacterium]|nr:sugar phosphotransferase [Microbacteriaceae bacterium]